MSKSLRVADMLLRMNDSTGKTDIEIGGEERELTMVLVLYYTLVCSVIVLVVILFGSCGACLGNRCVVSTSIIVTFLFALELLFIGVYAFSRYEVVEGTLVRQSLELCNSTIYTELYANMECSNSVNTTAGCGRFCKDRIKTLKKGGGCVLMQDLCKSWVYEEGTTLCDGLARFPNDAMDCENMCDTDITCQGYATEWDEHDCIHFSDTSNCFNSTGGGTILFSTQGRSAQLKKIPLAVDRFEDTSVAISMALFIASPILILLTLVMCCLSYGMNLNRGDKPTAENLCCLVFCPCCAGDHRGRGYTSWDPEGLE